MRCLSDQPKVRGKCTYLNKGHVDLVHIGPLFSVQLDTDKVVTHEFANFFIFKRLPLHNVTPVACRVAHCQREADLLEGKHSWTYKELLSIQSGSHLIKRLVYLHSLLCQKPLVPTDTYDTYTLSMQYISFRECVQ